MTTAVVVKSKKNYSKMIVYIGEFDKFDGNGKLLCRNSSCVNYPKFPYRKYCSKKCNKDFEHWYYHNFYWERVRSAKAAILTHTEGEESLQGLKL